MGKKEKMKKQKQQNRRHYRGEAVAEEEEMLSSAYNLPKSEEEEEEDEGGEEENQHSKEESPSKFLLYQKSVQAPKGDISYLQKFFLMYVGGRFPLHLQEDFCGTALLSTEWLRSDPRRTAVGIDLDLEALQWCLENNLNLIGPDGYSRISLFHGNVLQPSEASLVEHKLHGYIKNMTLNDQEGRFETVDQVVNSESTMQVGCKDSVDEEAEKKNCKLPAKDIICAFNYSCCCLQKRTDLVLYFKHALNALSRRGGIFVMDLYGGTSSEHKLRLQRKFPNFTVVIARDQRLLGRSWFQICTFLDSRDARHTRKPECRGIWRRSRCKVRRSCIFPTARCMECICCCIS
ncbi:uncharacterized protein LOC131234820 isoform X2 [Magnolia sinica]|uniref:uncharacterized protein LOC131234820 isoform X2 n=1 Tax=Magnolia sinica TaxID=86752 RepID=UPI00265B2619|nr:uncharacterized protein LOC131234820 isoform X2 [Magnolia sinica]